MTEEYEKLMQKYGITCEQRTVYFWKAYQYDKLEDAVNYAAVALENDLPPICLPPESKD